MSVGEYIVFGVMFFNTTIGTWVVGTWLGDRMGELAFKLYKRYRERK